jgi:hypothetical protein
MKHNTFGWDIASKYLKRGKHIYNDDKEIYMLSNGKLRYFEKDKIRMITINQWGRGVCKYDYIFGAPPKFISEDSYYGHDFILTKEDLLSTNYHYIEG